jgi:hypothetical protein
LLDGHVTRWLLAWLLARRFVRCVALGRLSHDWFLLRLIRIRFDRFLTRWRTRHFLIAGRVEWRLLAARVLNRLASGILRLLLIRLLVARLSARFLGGCSGRW